MSPAVGSYLCGYSPVTPTLIAPMKKIKKPPSLRTLKFRAFWLKFAAVMLPIYPLRRAYLQAYYRVWNADCQEQRSPDPVDVYENGIEWSRKPLPIKEADRLLALHDAAVDHDLDFRQTLEENLRHHH